MKKLIIFVLFLVLALPALAAENQPVLQEDIEAKIERGEIKLSGTTTEGQLPENQQRELNAARERGDNAAGATGSLRQRLNQAIKEKVREAKSKMGEEHRSAVANFVQGLLKVAERQPGGIGEQVREVARAQNDVEDKVVEAVDKIKTRSKVRQFFFGTDNQAVKELKKQILEARNRLTQLERAGGSVSDPAAREELRQQIENFKAEINRLAAETQSEEKKFSLFGWAKKIFNL